VIGRCVAGLVLALALLAPAESVAQTAQRRLTTIDALRQFPGYYHLQNVLLRGEFGETAGRFLLRSDTSEMRVQFSDGAAATSGTVEVRAQLVDIGRLEPGDARASGFTEGRADASERWPRPGEELFLQVTDVRAVDPGTTPSIRALALEPWKFVGQRVTLVGNFRGRNLFGDLPDSPAVGRYDFVLRGAEGSVWITGLRPRGKGFDLDVDRRVDTNRWLTVTGIVSHERGLVRIAAATLEAAVAPDDRPAVAETPAEKAPPEPVEIIFNSPADGDTDVTPTTPVRIQFSKGLAEGTVAGRFRARYTGTPDAAESDLPLRVTYDAATRSIEVRFAQPPERLRTVRVELLDGLTGFDGGPIRPWSISFSIAP
jgi:hypothetical protein